MTYSGSRRSRLAHGAFFSLLPFEFLPQKQFKVITNRLNKILLLILENILYLFNTVDLQNTYVLPVNMTQYHFSHFEFYTYEPTEVIY